MIWIWISNKINRKNELKYKGNVKIKYDKEFIIRIVILNK